MQIGETVQLQAIVTPSNASDKSVIWASSRQSVATISSSGLVTAVGLGTSTVTASCSGKSARCQVTVSEGTVAVVSVSLDPASVTLEEGGTTRLVATVSPADATDKTVTWSSSDATVVQVDQEGTVTAVKGGKVTITAQAGEQSAQAVVDVMEVTPVSVEVEGNGGHFDITVVTTRAYRLESKPEWISEMSVERQIHHFKAVVNNKTTERTGSIVFCDEKGTSLSCEVKQKGNLNLSVSPSSLSFDAWGGAGSLEVDTALEWMVSSNASWCRVTPSNGSGKGTLSVTVDEHRGQAVRNAAITVKSGDIIRTVNVSQEGTVPFDVNPTSVEMGEEGGDFTVTVSSTFGYHLGVLPDWISEVSVVGKVHSFRVAPHFGTNERSGVISFCEDGGTCIPVVVRQAPPLLGKDGLDWSRRFYHRSLFMRFTATWCGYCPMMYESILGAQADYPDRILHVAIHGFGSELYSSSFDPLTSLYQISSYPSGYVDGRIRIKNDDVDITVPKIVAAAKETESLYGTNTGIAVSSSLSGREVGIKLTAFAKKAGSYKLSVLLLEDDILASQDGATGLFYHMDVARVSVTDPCGDSFSISNDQSCKSFSYSASIPTHCVVERMKVLVYIQSEQNGGYVDNCLVAPLGKYMMVQTEGSTSGGNEGIVTGDDINYR